MTPTSDQRERLRNKASQHDDAKQNKKDNAKKSKGSFKFKGLGEGKDAQPVTKKSGLSRAIKPKCRTLKYAKKFSGSKFGVALITAVAVSSLFMIEDAVSNFRSQDNLDTTAVGKTSDEEPGNNKTFPNPPLPEEDTLRPAHVGMPGLEVDPKRAVAVGDSTVAWADGKKSPRSLSGCDVDRNTWSDGIGVKNLSCAGATTREISAMIREHSEVIRDSDTVFVTAGSNDIRGDKVGDLDNGIEELLASIEEINPEARVVFVGYLPVYIDDACMDIKDRNSARRLYDYHRKANYAMQDAALRNGMYYIDVFHSPFPVCDKNNAYVRIPRHQTQGILWHTTEAGHRKIAEDINGFITFIK